VDIASKGGNYLLNIGPKGDGSLTPETVASFRAIGAWMSVNGEAIHGTTASPFQQALPWGRATSKDRQLYLHIFEWPADGRLIVPVSGAPALATLLASPASPLSFESTPGGLIVHLPASAPDSNATVLRLSFETRPQPL
jgi:alpha-L-fucosidase